MISPIMTESPAQIFEQLGLNFEEADQKALKFGEFAWNIKVTDKPAPIFPRRKKDEEVAYIKAEMAKAVSKKQTRSEKKAKEMEAEKNYISIDDFDKVEIKVGQVLSVEAVEGSSKLLKFQMDFGDEKRQILSGMRKFYPDFEELVGKKILAVTNLKPRKMMGMESQGMLLSSEKGKKVKLAIVGEEHDLGALLG